MDGSQAHWIDAMIVIAGAVLVWAVVLRAPLRRAKERRMAKLVCPASGQPVDCLLVVERGATHDPSCDIERCSVFGQGAVTCQKACLAAQPH